MRFLIVDQCSSSKSYPEGVPVAGEEQIGDPPQQVIDDLGTVGIAACDLYTGKQQRRISDAVRILRNDGHEVERLFISAGFGLVDESEELPPYDATFSSMSDADIRHRSKHLGITQDLLDEINSTEGLDIVFLPLGADYYHSLEIDRIIEAVPAETTVVLFNREGDAEGDHIVSIPARTDEARENGSTVVGLKGTYLERFATHLETEDNTIDGRAVVELIRTSDTDQSQFEDYQ